MLKKFYVLQHPFGYFLVEYYDKNIYQYSDDLKRAKKFRTFSEAKNYFRKMQARNVNPS